MKVAYQDEGWAKWYERFIQDVYIDNTSSQDELLATFGRFSELYGFNNTMRQRAEYCVADYLEKRSTVQAVIEKFPNAIDLYVHLFGRQPKDDVMIKQSPFSVVLRPVSTEDFCYVVDKRPSDWDKRPDKQRNASAYTTGGEVVYDCLDSTMEGNIVIMNPRVNAINPYAEHHEDQHIRDGVFHENKKEFYQDDLTVSLAISQAGTEFRAAKTAEQKTDIIEKHFRKDVMRHNLFQAKEEGFAMITEGLSEEEMVERFTRPGRSYCSFQEQFDYRDLRWWYHNEKEFYPLVEEAREKILVNEHQDTIKRGFSVPKKILEAGYSRDETIGLLLPYHFTKWGEVAERQLKYRSTYYSTRD